MRTRDRNSSSGPDNSPGDLLVPPVRCVSGICTLQESLEGLSSPSFQLCPVGDTYWKEREEKEEWERENENGCGNKNRRERGKGRRNGRGKGTVHVEHKLQLNCCDCSSCEISGHCRELFCSHARKFTLLTKIWYLQKLKAREELPQQILLLKDYTQHFLHAWFTLIKFQKGLDHRRIDYQMSNIKP